jgi:hypothetical protein
VPAAGPLPALEFDAKPTIAAAVPPAAAVAAPASNARRVAGRLRMGM